MPKFCKINVKKITWIKNRTFLLTILKKQCFMSYPRIATTKKILYRAKHDVFDFDMFVYRSLALAP